MEKVAEVLQSLATQLGTTVEKLWPYLVKQQVIEGWVHLSTIVSLYLVLLVVFLSVRKQDGGFDGSEPNRYGVTKIIICVCTAILTLVALCCASDIVSQILNPEYAALKDLMCMVRGGCR